MIKKYLITGGCGFLGTNLADEVMMRGHTLCVFDNLSGKGSEKNLKWLRQRGAFEFHLGDIREADDIAKVVAIFRPDVIFHLAGQVAMTTSIADPRLDFEVNATGSVNLLEAVRSHVPLAAVIYSSTNKVYGDMKWVEFQEDESRFFAPQWPNGFDETIPLEFHSPYGCSKGAADQYMLDYARIFDLNTVVFRHSTIYGDRQFATFDQGWIGWFCAQALNIKQDSQAEPFTISGNGKQVRDVLHALDLRQLYFMAADNIQVTGGEVFNIGGGMHNSLSLLELFTILEELLEIKMNYTQFPPRVSDQKVFVADIAKASKLLSWQPSISARKGVERMLNWLA